MTLSREELDHALDGLGGFLDAVAERSPSPGGGAVAAACGALASAMGRMVAAYSPGKHGESVAIEEVSRLAEQLSRLDQMMRELIAEDADAYPAMVDAGRKAKADPSCQAEYDAATGVAIAVPLELMAVAVDMLGALSRLRPVANRYLLSDLGVAAILAEATVRASVYMVRVNTASIKDVASRQKIDQQVAVFRTKSQSLLELIESDLARTP